MLGLLSKLWNAIRDVPYLLLDGLVAVLNLLIAGLAAIGMAAISLLPDMPAEPDAIDSGVMGGLLWFLPLGPILAFFTAGLTCWLSFMAVKAAINWAKLL